MDQDKEIDFTHSGISEVPHLIYPNSVKITLRRNKIKNLPDNPELVSLDNLQTFDLYDNLLSSVPHFIKRLSQLKMLDLAFNNIEKVNDDEFPTSLEYLYLSSNRINEIPTASLRHLKYLTVLELGANKISTFPEKFEFDSLKELWLSGNRISNNGKLDFSHLPNLKILSLQCNKLSGTIFISSSFLSLPLSIEELYLSENQIENFQLAPEYSFPNLKVLDLSYNLISSLPTHLPSIFPLLNTLWLNNNKFCHLEHILQIIQRIPQLSDLFLVRNPFIQNVSSYNLKIRLACPKLCCLDGQDV